MASLIFICTEIFIGTHNPGRHEMSVRSHNHLFALVKTLTGDQVCIWRQRWVAVLIVSV